MCHVVFFFFKIQPVEIFNLNFGISNLMIRFSNLYLAILLISLISWDFSTAVSNFKAKI